MRTANGLRLWSTESATRDRNALQSVMQSRLETMTRSWVLMSGRTVKLLISREYSGARSRFSRSRRCSVVLAWHQALLSAPFAYARRSATLTHGGGRSVGVVTTRTAAR